MPPWKAPMPSSATASDYIIMTDGIWEQCTVASYDCQWWVHQTLSSSRTDKTTRGGENVCHCYGHPSLNISCRSVLKNTFFFRFLKISKNTFIHFLRETSKICPPSFQINSQLHWIVLVNVKFTSSVLSSLCVTQCISRRHSAGCFFIMVRDCLLGQFGLYSLKLC